MYLSEAFVNFNNSASKIKKVLFADTPTEKVVIQYSI